MLSYMYVFVCVCESVRMCKGMCIYVLDSVSVSVGTEVYVYLFVYVRERVFECVRV